MFEEYFTGLPRAYGVWQKSGRMETVRAQRSMLRDLKEKEPEAVER